MEPTADEDTAADAADLGTAAELLFDAGKVQAAALLIDARIAERIYVDTGFPVVGDGPGTDLFNLVLEVPRFLLRRFNDEVVSDIQDAFNEVQEPNHIHVVDVRVRAAITPASADWRETLTTRVPPQTTYQANIGPRMAKPLMEDRCQFRSLGELKVYRGFERARARLPADDSIAIAPNPALVVPNINTSEPDLVIMYRGRVGIVQVDGPHHNDRVSNELSRRRVYLHSGIAEVDHLSIEDTENDEDVDVFVTRFLKRLARS